MNNGTRNAIKYNNIRTVYKNKVAKKIIPTTDLGLLKRDRGKRELFSTVRNNFVSFVALRT
jgi:hypothetical protein